MKPYVSARRLLMTDFLSALPCLLMVQSIVVLLMDTFALDFPGISRPASALLLLLPFLCFFLIRTAVAGGLRAVLLHGAVLLLYLFAVAQYAFPVLMVHAPLSACLVIGSLVTRAKKSAGVLSSAPMMYAGLCLLCALFGFTSRSHYGFLFLIAVLALAAALASVRMARLNEHITATQDSTHFIAGRVFGAHDGVTAVFAAAVILVSALSYLSFATEPPVRGDIGSDSGTAQPASPSPDLMLQDDTEPYGVLQGQTLISDSRYPPPKGKDMPEISRQVFFLVGILALPIILVAAVMRYRSFQKRAGDSADIVITKVRRTRRKKRGEVQGAILPHQAKIRRMFYKKVRQHLKKGLTLHPRSTSSSLAEEIGRTEDIGELERLYRQARYGGE